MGAPNTEVVRRRIREAETEVEKRIVDKIDEDDLKRIQVGTVMKL